MDRPFSASVDALVASKVFHDSSNGESFQCVTTSTTPVKELDTPMKCVKTYSEATIQPMTSRSSLSDADTISNYEENKEVSALRSRFSKYWEYALQEFGCDHSGMMLKKDAALDGFMDADRQEIFEWLYRHITKDLKEAPKTPPLGKIVELGAGIGRLTCMFQMMAKKVVAVDFIQAFINKNKEEHSMPGRDDEFLCADAALLDFEDPQFDMVCWNWLLMYLSDEEVEKLVARALRWLKPGGLLFCRESCGEPSDKNKNDRSWAVDGNPTVYRMPAYYTWLFTEYPAQLGYEVECVFKERLVSVYSEKVGTTGQQGWLIRKAI